MDPAEFKREMDEFVQRTRTLEPVVGFDASYLPGGPEAESMRRYREEGIPVGVRHQERLENLAEELKIEAPW
jgi:LDH2 family malate/lactate/ureidoglycolate dehydrogenase